MSYGDGHQDQLAKDIAEIFRKSQARWAERERNLKTSSYNDGLHLAAMIVHSRWTVVQDDELKRLLEELERAIERAKVPT